MKLRRIKIDQVVFEMAFGRDADYHNPNSFTTYLNRDTGGVIYVYEDEDDVKRDGMDPEENRSHRQSIKENPDQYLVWIRPRRFALMFIAPWNWRVPGFKAFHLFPSIEIT